MIKKGFFIVLFASLLASCDQGSKPGKATPVEFETYTSYFLKNGTVPDNDMFYLATPNLAEFDIYFAPAATMSRQKWISEQSLKDSVVIAIADKIENDTDNLRIDSIEQLNDTLRVRYSIVKLDSPSTFTSRYCAIVLAPRKKASHVVFYEGDKEVHQLTIE